MDPRKAFERALGKEASSQLEREVQRKAVELKRHCKSAAALLTEGNEDSAFLSLARAIETAEDLSSLASTIEGNLQRAYALLKHGGLDDSKLERIIDSIEDYT